MEHRKSPSQDGLFRSNLFTFHPKEMQKRMAKTTIQTERCKGCGLCTTVCPRKILELDTEHLNAKGYTPARVTDMEKCIGCAICATMCPDVAITVER